MKKHGGMIYGIDAIPWHAPKLLARFKGEYEVKTTEEQGVGGTLFGSQHFGGRGAC
jgi:hypothetical protein